MSATYLRVRHAIGIALLSLATTASAAPARLTVEQGTLVANGLTLTTPTPAGSYRVVEGPRSGSHGIEKVEAPLAFGADLSSTLAGRGSLAFWFKTPVTYESGKAVTPFNEKLITLPGALAVTLLVEKSSVTLGAMWEGKREELFERHIRAIIPRLPGPAWHHIAVTWDGAKGECNMFINGTPFYVIGEKTAPFTIQPAARIVVHSDRFPVADVRVEDEPLSPEQIRSIVGASHYGTLAGILGAKEIAPISVDARRGPLLYERTFASETDMRDWVLEGPGILEFNGGALRMRSKLPDGPLGHTVYWCPEVFPDRFAAEWEFELLEPKGLCIVFFAARGQQGKDLFDPTLAKRTGVFDHYIRGEIDTYHISYFANTPTVPRAMANLRKNHGFFLLSNGPVGATSGRAGEKHRALLIKDGAHIQMSVDGRTIIDYIDDGQRAGPVWTEGRIGLRQMQWTDARYRNFRVYTLKK
ncbi:MAG: DUF1961 family protein [Verrucomicrobiota bacterium]